MLLLFKSFRKVEVFKSFVVTHRKCRRVFVVEYFENKLGNNRVLYLQKDILHFMMTILGRMTSMYIFTDMVPLSPVVSLIAYFGNLSFLVNQQVGDKNGVFLTYSYS